MHVAIIGYGVIAEVHARNLRAAGFFLGAVCGPDLAKAQAFASAQGCARVETDLDRALDGADAALIASPSACHTAQAAQVLARGLPALVELPACGSLAEARELAAAAAQARVVLQCAHTSLYMEPHRRIGAWIKAGKLGAISQINYFRSLKLNPRTWVDDPLWHHAGHPIDLLLHWFGDASPVSCGGSPAQGALRDVAVLARLAGGAPATISVSHSSKWITSRMTVVGAAHTVSTDGYSVIDSDDPDLAWRGDAAATFERAVRDQDEAFLRCCQTGSGGIPWTETLRQFRFLESARSMLG